MSHKKAKRLRNQLNYNPAADKRRKYVGGESPKAMTATAECDPRSLRGRYRALKKELKNEN